MNGTCISVTLMTKTSLKNLINKLKEKNGPAMDPQSNVPFVKAQWEQSENEIS